MSDEKMIITISREYGSDGHAIAKQVAERLGIPFYDRAYFLQYSKDMNLDKNKAAQANEAYTSKASYLSKRVASELKGNLAGWDFVPSDSDILYEHQKNMLLDLAEKGSLVVCGRCANVYLREKFKTLNIFVYAPLDVRIKKTMEHYNITEKEAAKRLRHIDNVRKQYYNHYTGLHFGEPESYDMMLNSTVFGLDETATHIIRTAEHYFTEK